MRNNQAHSDLLPQCASRKWVKCSQLLQLYHSQHWKLQSRFTTRFPLVKGTVGKPSGAPWRLNSYQQLDADTVPLWSPPTHTHTPKHIHTQTDTPLSPDITDTLNYKQTYRWPSFVSARLSPFSSQRWETGLKRLENNSKKIFKLSDLFPVLPSLFASLSLPRSSLFHSVCLFLRAP